jgi:transcriptional regulator with XRE-family HTH domain
MTFAERLKQLRIAAGLSARDLSILSGLAWWTVRAIEQNRNEPRLYTAWRLAEALGLGLTEMLQPVELSPWPAYATVETSDPAAAVLGDELWADLGSLLPRRRGSLKGGRRWLDDRACLATVVVVLRSGTPWDRPPPQAGLCAASTCLRRLRDWGAAGLWPQLRRRLQAGLADGERINWSRADAAASGPRPRISRLPLSA